MNLLKTMPLRTFLCTVLTAVMGLCLSLTPFGSFTVNAQSSPVEDLYVSAADGVDAGDCTDEMNPCATIPYAFTQASSAGETIYVDAGTYADAFDYDQGVNLSAWNDGVTRTGSNTATIITGMGNFAIPGDVGTTSITISNVRFEDTTRFNITDGTGLSGGITFNNTVLDFDGGSGGCFLNVANAGTNFLIRFTLTNNTITSCGGNSTDSIFTDSNNANFTTFVMTGNSVGATSGTPTMETIGLTAASSINFSNNTYSPFLRNGINMLSTGGQAISSLTFTNNTYLPNAGSGDAAISITNVSNPTDITNNNLASVMLTMSYANTANFTVADNYFSNLIFSIASGGIGTSDVTIERNRITSFNGYQTLSIEAADVLVQNNIIHMGNAADGTPAETVLVADGNHTYVNNTFTSNLTDPVIKITDTDNTHIVRNNIFNRQSEFTVITCDTISGDNVTIEYNHFYFSLDALLGGGVEASAANKIVNDNGATCDEGSGNTTSQEEPEYEALATGTFDSSTSNSITDNGIGFTADEFVGKFLQVVDGGGEPAYFYIFSNTTETIEVLLDALTAFGAGDYGFGSNKSYSIHEFEPSEESTRIVDAGTATGAPDDDIEGTDRPDGNGVDLGAFESAYAINAAPTVTNIKIDNVLLDSQTNANVRPLVSWDYADENDNAQASFQIEMTVNCSGMGCLLPPPTKVYDSGTVAGAATSHQTVLANFQNGYTQLTAETIFRVRVTVSDGIDSTTSSYATFTVGTPGHTINDGGGITIQEGSTAGSFTVVLDTRPAANVTVTVTPDAQLTVNSGTLTFTGDNWSTPQTVEVSATDDATVEGDHTGDVTLSFAGPGEYDGTSDTVTVNITDAAAAPTSNSGSGGGSSSGTILNLINRPTPVSTPDDEESEEIDSEENTDQPTQEDPQSPPEGANGATGDFSDNQNPSTVVSPNPNTDGNNNDAPSNQPTTDGLFNGFLQLSTPEIAADETPGAKLSKALTDSENTFEDFGNLLKAIDFKQDEADFRDSDADGLSNSLERAVGLNPSKADSDGDGLTDGEEIAFYGSNPLVKDADPTRTNVLYPSTGFGPKVQLPVAAPLGSKINVYYLDEKGNRYFLTTTYSGENNLAVVNVEGLPEGQTVEIVTEIETPDGRVAVHRSKAFEVRLARLTDDTRYITIDGTRVRLEENKTYIVRSNSPVVIAQTGVKNLARVNFSSLVFGSMILSDSTSGRVVTEIPNEILSQPGVHRATLTAFDPDSAEYSDPLSISFVYSPERLLPFAGRSYLSLLDMRTLPLIILSLVALAGISYFGLKYWERKHVKKPVSVTPDGNNFPMSS